MRSILILTFFLLSLTGFAQDYKADLRRMGDFYRNADTLSMDIEVTVFSASASPFVQKASIRKLDKMFYYELADLNMLITERSVIIIHKEEKEILYRPVRPEDVQEFFNQTLNADLDSAIARYDSVRYEGESGGIRHYIVYPAMQGISRTDVYLNRDASLNKVIYGYDQDFTEDQERVEIVFNSGRKIKEPVPELFSERKYIARAGGKVKPSAAYSTYQLIEISDEDF